MFDLKQDIYIHLKYLSTNDLSIIIGNFYSEKHGECHLNQVTKVNITNNDLKEYHVALY